jgi:hypothetical protein
VAVVRDCFPAVVARVAQETLLALLPFKVTTVAAEAAQLLITEAAVVVVQAALALVALALAVATAA